MERLFITFVFWQALLRPVLILRTTNNIYISFNKEFLYSSLWHMMFDFWDPLFPDILEGNGRDDAEANKKNICLWIRQRAKTIVVLLTRRVKQA